MIITWHSNAVCAQGASQFVQRAYIDRATTHDPGMIIAVLKNTTDKPIHIGTITVNGHPLRQWPAVTNPVAWHRLTSSDLLAGETAILTAKFAQYTGGLIRLTFQLNGQSYSSLLSGQESDPLRIAAIRYGSTGTRVNVFLQNTGTSLQQVRHIEIDGEHIWSSQHKSGLDIEPGAIEVARIILPTSLEAGHRLRLVVQLADRIIAVTDRSIPGFRISVESGQEKMARRIAADPLVLDSFQFRDESTQRPGSAATTLATRQGSHWSLVRPSHGKQSANERRSDLACVFTCPTHATDSYHTSAYLAMLAQNDVDKQPGWQSFLHTCRTQALRGIAVFGQIADSIRYNAQLDTAATSFMENRDELPWTVYQLARYAVESSAPSIAIPMVPMERNRPFFREHAPTAVEARQMVYAALAAGAGGIAYRVNQKEWGKDARDQMIDQVTAVNHEIRQVRDLLAMGYPRDIALCNDPMIQVACIDAWPLGMIVLLINHDLEKAAPEMPRSVEAIEHRDVAIMVRLPQGVSEARAFVISGDQRRRLEDGQWEDTTLQLTIPSVTATKMILIAPRAESDG